MKNSKKKILLPFVVFLIGMGILGGTIYSVKNNQQKQNRTMATLNAMTYAEHLKTDFMRGISVTDTLEQIIVSENGKVKKFAKVAENLITADIQSIQIAPDGVVTDIYPAEGNEAGKIDLIHDKDRGKISRYARDNQVAVMQGPFELKQGGYGIVVRNPVYLDQKDGEKSFWGFTIVIIRVPDIFADTVKALSDFGYGYRLSKTTSPWEDSYKVVYDSDKTLKNPVSYVFEIGGNQWKLEVEPQKGWVGDVNLYAVLVGGILIVVLLTGLTGALLVLDEHRKRFQKLAVTDALTGIYNRHGFDAQVMQYLKQHPEDPCVGVQFDIDDFKLINDLYGHASGDRALQIISEGMQNFFPKKSILGRNGGDEFCILIPDCTCEQIAVQME